MLMSPEAPPISTPEQIPTIALSPERLGKALNLEADEVREQLRSAEGRSKLLEDLQKDPKILAAAVDGDSVQMIREDLALSERDLQAEQNFLAAQKDPEKKGMFRRAWDTVTGFPRKHPLITVTLLGVVLGVVASYMGWLPAIDFPGLWGKAQGWMGWGEAAGESAAEGATAIGTEVAAGAFSEDLGIRIFEHSYIYGDKIYSMEELPQLIEKLPALPEGEFFRILPYASSRPMAEMALSEALKAKGLPPPTFLEKFAKVNFIPTP